MAQFYRSLLVACFFTLFSGTIATAADCDVAIAPPAATSICAGGQIVLTASSTSAGATYQWYKDGDIVAGATTNRLTVTTPGDYTVEVKGTSCDTKTSPKVTITQGTAPATDFTFDNNVCSGTSVKFTGTPAGTNYSYAWDFGDPTSGGSNTSTEKDPSHTFISNGNGTTTYTVKLTVTTPGGCTKETTKVVTLSQRPDASLEDIGATRGFTVAFTNCASGASDYILTVKNTSSTKSTNQSYSIDWGDGTQPTVGSFDEQSHTYKKQGSFNLVYKVKGQNGCETVRTIQVFNGSNPSLSVGSPGTTSGCAPKTFTFPITDVKDNSPSTTYIFQFDDGSPAYTFTQANVPTSITHTFLKSSCGTGTKSAFTLTASAINPCSDTKVTVGSIFISEGPKADFVLDPQNASACINSTYALKNTSLTGANVSNGTCIAAATYEWVISPATGWTLTSGTLTSREPVIKFTQKGTYTITLKVKNSCSEDIITKTVNVVDLPVSKFETNISATESGCKNLEVKPTNQSTGEQLTYRWSVTPNSGYTVTSGTLTSKEPTFLFTAGGVYTLNLETTSPCQTSTSSKQITVKAPPTITLPGTQAYCGPQKLAFSSANARHNPVYEANLSTISAYKWTITGTPGATFASPSSETSANPIIDFPTAGTYTVTVTATNECGTSVAASQTITIQDLPPAPTVAGATICEGEPITLTANGGPAGSTYKWYAVQTNGTALATGPSFTPSPALSTTTTFYVETLSAVNCTSITRTAVTVTVNKGISNNVLTAQGPLTICEGQAPRTITGSTPSGGDGAPYPFVWQISTDGITFTNAPAPNDQKDYTPGVITQDTWFRRSISSQACPPNLSNVIAFTFSPLPQVPVLVESNVGICQGQRADLLVKEETGITYKWYSASTGGNPLFTGAAYRTPVLSNDQVYYVEGVNANNCVSTTRAEVKVKVAPAITNNTVSGAKSICSGLATSFLTGSTPAGGDGSFTYSWESSTTSATASDFAPVSTNGTSKDYTTEILTQTTWFRRIVRSGGCSSVSATVQITVDPSPAAPVAAGKVICEGSRATLSVNTTSGGSYQWFTQAVGGNPISQSSTYTTPILSATTTYYVQLFNSQGCNSPRTAVEVTVNKTIGNNSISADQMLCAGATPSLLKGSVPSGGDGVYTFLWESSTLGPDTGFGLAKGTNTEIDYQPTDITTATWFRRKVTAGPCPPSMSGVVKISVNPVISENRISFPQSVCLGNRPAPLSGTQVRGGDGTFTYLWESSTTGPSDGFTLASGDNKSASYQPDNITRTTWYRRTVLSGGCSNTSSAVQITVVPVVANNTITANQTICSGDASQALAGSAPTGGTGVYTYLWESSTDGLVYSPATGENKTRNYSPGAISTTTWYRRTVSSGPCSESNSPAIKITVNTPITNNFVQADQDVCAGVTPALLQGSVPAGGSSAITYQWEVSTEGATGTFTAAPGNSTGATYQPGSLTTTSWFRRVVISAPCLRQPSNVVKITVNPLPAAPTLVNQNPRVCPGEGTNVTVRTSAAAAEWYDKPQGGNLLYTGLTFPTPALKETTTYFVQAVSAEGCPSSKRTEVKVEVVPPQANAGPDVTIIQGRSANLTATGGVKYEWSPSTGLSSVNTAATIATPQETTTYIVTVTSAEGCFSKDEVTVTVLPQVFVSNVLTANRDGINDEWEIQNIEKYPNAKVEVFNRWGTKLFSSVGYKTKWDGTYQGQPLPVAAYYYIIYLNKDEEPISGSITIIN